MNNTVKLLAGVAGLAAGAMLIDAVRRRMYSFRGRAVLITGGSRGLGLELARRLLDEGARVAICARTESQLWTAMEELQQRGEMLAVQCDVANPGDVSRLVMHVARRWGGLDVLVNNAGVIQVGPVDCMTQEDFRQAMNVHFWGPLNAIRAALPYLPRDGTARIVNIASIGGLVSVPHLLPYSASKFALVGLSEGLHAELAPYGIKVTTVCPGMMRTGSPRNAQFKGQHRAEYAWFSISDSLPALSVSSERAAKLIVEACRGGQPHLTISLPAKAARALRGLLPGLTAHAMSLANRVLPTSQGSGTRAYTGAQSFSAWSPSVLTTLTEQAAAKNNEL